jgi:hypothetical protein
LSDDYVKEKLAFLALAKAAKSGIFSRLEIIFT